MITLNIKDGEEGGRLDRYIQSVLKKAPKSFIYKMLRKKNILLNRKKAEGNELLKIGDSIEFFLSDETFNKFKKDEKNEVNIENLNKYNIEIIYEDEDIIILNKPVNLLSQPSKKGDFSVNEWLYLHLRKNNDIERLNSGVANRLDRNTSGLILAGKNTRGLRFLSNAISDKEIRKTYITVVEGSFKTSCKFTGYLKKDEKKNLVTIGNENTSNSHYIETNFIPIVYNEEYSLVECELITGKSHQIRISLATLGYPILGDRKYNKTPSKKGAKFQLLHSYKLEFMTKDKAFNYLNRRVFIAEPPNSFLKILSKTNLMEGYSGI